MPWSVQGEVLEKRQASVPPAGIGSEYAWACGWYDHVRRFSFGEARGSPRGVSLCFGSLRVSLAGYCKHGHVGLGPQH